MRVYSWQEANVLPGLQATLRCFAHAGQKSLENAMKTDERVNMLLDSLITRFAGSKNHQKGSLARALKNSSKLTARFKAEVTTDFNNLAEVSQQCANSSNFVCQRWDSILTMLRLICVRINPLLNFLCKLVAGSEKDCATWAESILEVWSQDLVCHLNSRFEHVTPHEHEFSLFHATGLQCP